MPARTGKNVIEDLKDYLRHRIETGDDTDIVDPAILDGLGRGSDIKAPEPKPAETPVAESEASPEPPAEPVAEAEPVVDDAEPVSGPTLEQIAEAIADCEACALCSTRTKTVPGQGAAQPEIMFVGAAPSADEDQQGLAIVGAAGDLLTRMLMKLGLSRDEVFITNLVKCHPLEGRDPEAAEMDACIAYLDAQIALLEPKLIVTLGRIPAQRLLKAPKAAGLRGNWAQYKGVDLMPTYDPEFLLQDANKEKRRDTWGDMLKVLEKLGRQPPA